MRLFLILLSLTLGGVLGSCSSQLGRAPLTAYGGSLDNLVQIQPAFPENKPESRKLRKPADLALVQPELEFRKLPEKGPRFTLSARDVPIKTILMALAKEIEQSISINQDISLKATVDLKNVTLLEALDSLLKPYNLKYEMKKDFIHVYEEQMETRVFNLNYLQTRRQGSGGIQALSFPGLIVNSSESKSTPQGPGTVLASLTGLGQRVKSSIFSYEETDLWSEISEGLQKIVSSKGSNRSFQGTHSYIHPAKGEKSEEKTGESGRNREQAFFTLNKQAGVIMVHAYPGTLFEVAEFLEAVEGSIQRQVLIRAEILEVKLGKNYPLGIDWDRVSPLSVTHSGAGISESLWGDTAGLFQGVHSARSEVIIAALAQQGEIRILSRPKILTLNNQRAVIKVGREHPIFIPEMNPNLSKNYAPNHSVIEHLPSSISVGIILDVLPQINPNGQIMLHVNTSVTETEGKRISPDRKNRVPVLSVSESNNVILVKTGQTVVMGGLMKRSGPDNSQTGHWFHRKPEPETLTELVIMLIPEIVTGSAANPEQN